VSILFQAEPSWVAVKGLVYNSPSLKKSFVNDVEHFEEKALAMFTPASGVT
jgi:hypothetical protein